MTAHARDIAAGTRLGTYEVLRKLATGGMAEIYLARVRGQFDFEKLVVLKTILPSVADDPAYVAMFLDEARLAATLHHPNIAQVYDVGSDGGMCFFAMEFVHGEDARTLRQAARRSGAPLPLAHALAVIHATASALHYAHDKAIVHRDVSPSNILISYDGAVKLVDFGIARAQARETKTRTGTLKGKIPYMSPEQCRGLPTDRRSDLFSLGVCLQELTVGRRPFHGNGNGDFAILEQIVHGAPTRPSELIPDFPPALEHIICRLIARDPDDRYPTGEEMLIDLEAYIADVNLRVSSITLGRYMQGLFAEKIAAWHQADSEGVSLAQHVAQTITSESRRSERIVTPTSSVRPAGAWSRTGSTPPPVTAKVAKTADAAARKRSATMPPLGARSPAAAAPKLPPGAVPIVTPPPPPPARAKPASAPPTGAVPSASADAETGIVTAAVTTATSPTAPAPRIAAAATALAQTRAPGPRSAPRAVAVPDDDDDDDDATPPRVSLLGPAAAAPPSVTPPRRGLALVIAALAIGGAGVGIGMYVARTDDAPTAVPATTTDVPAPTAPGSTTTATPIVPAPAPAAVTDPVPVPVPVPDPVPAPVAVPVPDPEPEPEAAGTTPEIAPVVIEQPRRPTRPAKKPKKPRPKPADDPEDDPKEDATWDRDSPFLPQ